MRFAAIRIFVHDLAPARRFYQVQLGLPLRLDDHARGWCGFDLGSGVQLIVEAVAPDAPEDEQALVGRFAGLSFEVGDIQLAWRQLRDAGVWFAAPPEQQAWGGWLATFEDPAGNRLQLVQYPN